MATTITDHLRLQDIETFKRAARRFNLYVLVRRTNPKSLAYIGRAGYSPKRLDCKFKTADSDFFHPGYGRVLEVGGLVVDPTLPGFQLAFNPDGNKHANAKGLWAKYARHMIPDEFLGDSGMDVEAYQASGRPYLREGKLYFVDRTPGSKHFGCVKFAPGSLVTNSTYVHGDYDLYDVVPADNPSENIAVRERRFQQMRPGAGGRLEPVAETGVAHVRGQAFMDLQLFLKNEMGAVMVQHGSQAKYSGYTEDEVDCFFPDGMRTAALIGMNAIKRFYDGELQGRPHFDEDAADQTHFGQWVKRSPG